MRWTKQPASPSPSSRRKVSTPWWSTARWSGAAASPPARAREWCWRAVNRWPAILASFDHGLLEQHPAEKKPGNEQGPEDIHALRANECERRASLVARGELDEAGLQADADEGHGEPPQAQLAERAARAAYCLGRQEEREDQRSGDEADDKLRETLPDHRRARPLAFRRARLQRPPDREREGRNADERVLRELDDHAGLHRGLADEGAGGDHRGAGVERPAEPRAGDQVVHPGGLRDPRHDDHHRHRHDK